MRIIIIFQTQFDIFDQDQDTTIDVREFQSWMAKHGKFIDREALESVIKSGDQDGNAVIDKNEFLQIVCKKIFVDQLLQRRLIEN